MKLKDLIKKYGEYDVGLIETPKGQDEWSRVHLFKPKPKSVWDLGKGDKCYYISLFGDVEDTGGYLIPLSKAIDMGVVFLTEEEANKDLERRKVETLLLKHGGRRWFKKSGENWILRLDKHNQATRFEVGEPYQGFIYFDSHEEAVNACEQIGNKRIVKALFEVR